MWIGRCRCPNWISERGPVGVHVQREGQLEQLLPLGPVDLGDDVEHRVAGAQRQQLGDRRRADRRARPARAGPGSTRQRVELDQVPAGAPVVLVDVPGVPLGRGVPEQLQQVGRRVRGDQLAVGAEVADRGEQAPAVDHDPDRLVGQHDAVGGLGRPSAPAPGGADRPAAQRRRPVHRVRARVAGQLAARPARSARPARRRSRASSSVGDPGVLALGLLVHPGDRGARAGCRGTAAAAPCASSAAAVGTGRRRRRAPRPWSPTARPRAAGARCAGCPAWSGPGEV